MYGVAKPDGLTLGAVNPALYFDQLVGRSEVKFDWGKFNWIGSPEKNDVVYYMRADTPFKTIEDLRNAKEPAKCGSTGTGSTGHYIPRLLEETLGIKTQIVSGYPGAPDIELAIERGEVYCWSPLLATYFGREPYQTLAQVRLRARPDANRGEARPAPEGHANAERAHATI